jgi:hypothetical protein
MRALQKELDELREARQREKDREARRARETEGELQILRDRLQEVTVNGEAVGFLSYFCSALLSNSVTVEWFRYRRAAEV